MREPSRRLVQLPGVLLCVVLTSAASAQAGTGGERAPQEPSPQESRPVNHLADSTSPYLLQHRHNPVDWYPWGKEALARARAEDKPIFLSIGYAACHWCHVMERESFENEAIAAYLNEHFVCIKVDREERPDLDEIYMAAVTAMTGHGGWPMSVFLTPGLEPFFGGTYYPPEDSRGMPGFPRVLRHVQTLWSERRELVEENADKVAEHLRQVLAPRGAPGDPSPAQLAELVEQSAERFDDTHGGFGSGDGRFAPKFPHAAELMVLLRRRDAAGEPEPRALQMATQTLDAMARGGIYDHLGGGFHRYSVDREWLVPHFEKMLYDNALLAQCYAESWRLTGDADHRRVVVETLDYLLREMQDPAGGFWSTTDADSEGEEGRFYVWDLDEVESLLGDDARAFALRYDVTAAGNWEGRNILRRVRSVEEVAAELKSDAASVRDSLARGRRTLLAARGERVAPATDDKVLAAWNGMAITALCAGFRITGETRYLDAARRAASFLATELRRPDGRLLRSWRDGRAQLDGYLEDHAYVADALLHLFECDGDPRWLHTAQELIELTIEHFGDPEDGSFFFTADDHEQLLTRTKAVQESSTPSGIAMMVLACLRGSLLLADEELWERGLRALRAHHELSSKVPVACPGLLLGVGLALGDPREVVVSAASRDDAAARALLERAWRSADPNLVVAPFWIDSTPEATSPIFAGKTLRDGAAAAWVCRRGRCEAPVTDPAALDL